eukprot:CAMPEP_0174375448 /NCGR_PEP_ID=MMETSP0811_2-20130205/114613_1 /TAXON_ID=73025 ORGANISM="Eutreptiella gymnastica-like, Strain CCMP1594" /NCGR_SAMPLE_ID=MMETSP0811_2 /ASSEMBLY_ACC=CAM_ASM_000667 /LENGTH=156 /DNA_ID=CAMNT_0015525683 /DNA_START=26 /DNA_END=496 /DNA_ORIENTATION=+
MSLLGEIAKKIRRMDGEELKQVKLLLETQLNRTSTKTVFMEEIAKLIRNLDNEELKQIKCLADVQIARSFKVEGLPDDCTSDHLAAVFSDLAPFGGYSVKRGLAGTKYGLITFQSDSKAAKALHRNGMWYLGQHQIAVLSLAQIDKEKKTSTMAST